MTTTQLHQKLWDIANTLRNKMNANDFKDYILGFIFLKYLSEKMNLYADKLLAPDGMRYSDIDASTKQGQQYLDAIKQEALLHLGYYLAPSELFAVLTARGNSTGQAQFILDDLSAVLRNVEQSTMGSESEDDFGNLFEDLDLTSSKLGKSANAKNELIVEIMHKLSDIDFRLDDQESDILGDAYEYLIGEFASNAGKKAGEFYTPVEASTILARIVTTDKDRLRNIYDPTCGSGSLLLRVAKEVKEVSAYYGQELNPTTYNLCRMNMIMHNIHYSRFDIRNEDTLKYPQHIDMRFDAIVANPPFSQKWSASPLFQTDDRFGSYGRLAPKSKADFAFVLHMVHHLNDEGTMACVLPHGVLFRGAAEGHIRQVLIEDRNYLDAVIGLPPNIFFGTSIPTCIIVLKKNRKHRDNILFVDASGDYEKEGNKNQLRATDIDKIISTYRNRSTIEKYSHVADMTEIIENDYNLNIPRYVDTFEPEPTVDLSAVAQQIKALDREMKDNDNEIAKYCDELGIEAPI